MSLDKIKETVERILERKEVVKGKGEEATKQAMILPMIEALGYDIWNPGEVCPEFESDTAVKKSGQKEKVDYAILLGGSARIFIEAKSIDEKLADHDGQLKRYFNSTTDVALGILTNGLEYRFYTDTQEQNIQDPEPFYTFNLESVEPNYDVLIRFQKDVFSSEAIRDYATELTYTAKITDFLGTEMDVREGGVSDELCRWVLTSGVYEGRVTANVLDRFKPIVRDSLQRVIRKIVRRTVAAIDSEVSSAEVVPEIIEVEEDEDAPRRGIETTEEELAAFSIIKEQFETSALGQAQIYEPAVRNTVPIELGYRDTSGYFGVYLNKTAWWALRLSLSSRVKWIGFNLSPEQVEEFVPESFEVLPGNSTSQIRVKVDCVDDLHALNRVIYASFEKTVADREAS